MRAASISVYSTKKALFCPKATCADSLAIAADSLRAKGRLSFKTGVFGAIEPPKAARRALWDKN